MRGSLWLTFAIKTYLQKFFSGLQTGPLTIMLEGGEETTDPSLNTLLAHNKGILSVLVAAAETNRGKNIAAALQYFLIQENVYTHACLQMCHRCFSAREAAGGLEVSSGCQRW